MNHLLIIGGSDAGTERRLRARELDASVDVTRAYAFTESLEVNYAQKTTVISCDWFYSCVNKRCFCIAFWVR
jgi:hypothetical protein